MSCECCQEQEPERSRDYYDGLSDGLRYAARSLESVYGYRDKDLPRPVLVVLSYLGELGEELESLRFHRFTQDTGARVPSEQDLAKIRFEERRA